MQRLSNLINFLSQLYQQIPNLVLEILIDKRTVFLILSEVFVEIIEKKIDQI